MVVTTSVRAQSWDDDVHACALTPFVPYPLHKFRLTSSFSYFWPWHLSALTLCHVLSADYVCVRLVHFFSFFLRFHTVETIFRTILLCLHVVSCPVSFCLHTGFDYFSSSLHVGLNFFWFELTLNTFPKYCFHMKSCLENWYEFKREFFYFDKGFIYKYFCKKIK